MSITIYHTHHIIPKHFGGSNDPNNLINLTISEHAAWHYELWVYYGKQEDWLAWQGLSNQIGNDEIKRIVFSNAGKIGGKIKKTWNKGLKNVQEPMSSTMRQKLSKERTGKKRQQWEIDKIVEGQSKLWLVIDPNGNEFIIKNLKQFCQNNGLNNNHMAGVAKGTRKTAKRWKCQRLFTNLRSDYKYPD